MTSQSSGGNQWRNGTAQRNGRKLGLMPRLFLSLFVLSVARNWRGQIGQSTTLSPQARGNPIMTLPIFNRYVDNATGVRRTERLSEQPGEATDGSPVLYWKEDLKKLKNKKIKLKK